MGLPLLALISKYVNLNALCLQHTYASVLMVVPTDCMTLRQDLLSTCLLKTLANLLSLQ